MATEVGSLYTPPALRDVPTEKVIKSMSAIGRLAGSNEIAAVAAFLLSPDASYLTGAAIDASGSDPLAQDDLVRVEIIEWNVHQILGIGSFV